MKMKRFALALVVPLALATTACGSGSGDGDTIKIGVTDGAQQFWQVYKDLAKEQGITVETTNFSDYQQPNAALNDGDLQINEYQHLQFLAEYNVKNKTELVPIGATAIYPLPLYSKKHKSVAEIPQGGTVVVPDDPTNQSRALGVLSSAGLIKLKGEVNRQVTPADIDTAASKVSVRPVDANQTALSLDSVDGAVVNNDPAENAKLGKDLIIAKDDPASPQSQPFINAFVVRKADKDNATYLKLAQLYKDQKVLDQLKKDKGDSFILVDKPAAELQSLTESLQQQVTARGTK
ncbi:NLPA lipoprotein OS=Tsukamurella paurometabola (strain ATCC 8368 / DSM / CCUG 35730 / CIP 100753/ JCM 10117 / KCTC 9821 / NBRC 16120 / NCIMB 702349 / NCTC 13040) OX=521096 GN=Tpau_1651 PE=3 SV=1 [Tsukamurella paurometabola]|uniref:NLPA lipoprotein n=1 Tax=Tsukamurella paurometabola (strain ATCC 8368 / DSM 20162 / CCUG 35730 / CIP 100753 / JCM 10117 / KCTC 9821 / NBRC 16120 / NCIMB 702349 / NCTC 13040) TaxID=521096 RepID=D5UYG5_TSUPD|nr:NLPA lipoprotein [Tsukamurella paurometabola DSM 20162]SUP30963.1 28 kDa outer membrane protein [Tsukamurella paurometabola]